MESMHWLIDDRVDNEMSYSMEANYEWKLQRLLDSESKRIFRHEN